MFSRRKGLPYAVECRFDALHNVPPGVLQLRVSNLDFCLRCSKGNVHREETRALFFPSSWCCEKVASERMPPRSTTCDRGFAQ